MVYLVGFCLSYCAVIAYALRLVRSRLVFGVPLLYIGFIIVVRNSGTDTYVYEEILRAMLAQDADNLLGGLEPAFVLSSKVSLWIANGDEKIALRLIGLFFVILAGHYILRASKVELGLFFLYFVPSFIYNYGMNAVRAGIGMVLFLLAWQALRRGRFGLFGVLSFVGSMFHYSMVIVFFAHMLTELRLKNWRFTFLLFLVGVAFLGMVFARYSYFQSKFEAYVVSDSPSRFSGFANILQIGMLSAFFLFSKRVPIKRRVFVLSFIVGLAGFSQLVAIFSYAGLRFLNLIAFLAPLVYLREFDRVGESPPASFWLGLTVAGVLGALFAYRGFVVDYDGQLTGTLTPFLPYRTIFDEGLW